MVSRVVMVGGPLETRRNVVDALPGIHIVTVGQLRARSEVEMVRPDATILIHPEALELVREIHALAPSVVVAPEDEDLANVYLLEGIEDVVFDAEVGSRPGYLARTLNRASSRWQSRRRLELDARVDPLTELLNRRGVEAILGRVRGRDQAVALLVDLDDFKAINEARGHAGGDAVLRAVANAIRDNARPTDVLARIGGDEFLVVLPGADLMVGQLVAERMRKAIEEVGVTASFGLAPVTKSAVVDLVTSTQDALRSGKRGGKNCVVCTE